MPFYFYILRCSDNTLYSGQTTDLKRRIAEHNLDSTRSAKYMRGRKPVVLVYFEKYPTRTLALKRELEVKRWTKQKKEALVSKATESSISKTM